jgi:hypothetical protein
MSQNACNTRRKNKASTLDLPSNHEPSQKTLRTQKSTSTSSESSPTLVLNSLEYDFVEELNNTKANISLFELMKLPQIQEKFINTLQGSSTRTSKDTNVGEAKKNDKYAKNTDCGKKTAKKQSTINASLIVKRSKYTTPPFLLTFEIFNSNVHNCIFDLGASSNVIPFKVCEKLNAKTGIFLYSNHTIG